MNKKLILILLSTFLVLLLGVMLFYSLNQKEIGEQQKKDNQKVSDLNDDYKQEDDLKEGYSASEIKNKLFKESNIEIPEEGKISDEEFNKIKEGRVNSALGVIKSKQDNKIVVEFSHLGESWTSEVLFNEDSVVYSPSTSPDKMGEIETINDLNVREEVIVNGEDSILNLDSFTAISVHKVGPKMYLGE